VLSAIHILSESNVLLTIGNKKNMLIKLGTNVD
jgi:hypothetical protein